MQVRWGILMLSVVSGYACAWGDQGHEIVVLVAARYFEPGIRTRIDALLRADQTNLTATDLVHEAIWADRYRDLDRDTTRLRYEQTRRWHFVNTSINTGDVGAACFGHPALTAGIPALAGPAAACAVDKIDQFADELARADTPPSERRAALQFLLHLVGDIHQPLHAADDTDGGGNAKRVSARNIAPGTLHHYWDTEFVRRLGGDANVVAETLVEKITDAQVRQWSADQPSDWALESFEVAKRQAYGRLPRPRNDIYYLDASYTFDATRTVASQLSKAGVRLAKVLNEALRR
jgi:nuclease S1